MAIQDGERIKIRFTEPLVGDVTGLNPPAGSKTESVAIIAASSKNSYSTGYSAMNAIDGSTSTYWRGTTQENWLHLTLIKPYVVKKLRLYMGTYYVKTLSIDGSNDGVIWSQIAESIDLGVTSGSAHWTECTIQNDTFYKYYRLNTLTAYSSTRIDIYEVQLIAEIPLGNESKFHLKYQEYDHVPGGTLHEVVRTLDRVEGNIAYSEDVDLAQMDHKEHIVTIDKFITLEASNG